MSQNNSSSEQATQAFSPQWIEKGKKYELTNDGHIRSARAVIQNGQGEYLFLYDHRWDVYALPGGKVDHGESPIQGLQREVYEELDIELGDVTLLGSVKTIWSSGGSCGSYYQVADYTGTPRINEPDKFTSLHRVSVSLVNGQPVVMIDGKDMQLTYHTPRWMWHARDACVLANMQGLAQSGDQASYQYCMDTIDPDGRYVCLFDQQTSLYYCVHQDDVHHFVDPYVFLTQSGKELIQGLDMMYGEGRQSVLVGGLSDRLSNRG